MKPEVTNELKNSIVESSKQKSKRGWKGTVTSLAIHGLALTLIAVLSGSAVEKVQADESPIPVFIQQGGAAPPPPPPPPAPGSSAPQQAKVDPVEVPEDTFAQPEQTPREVPLTPTTTAVTTEEAPSSESAPELGVDGGVAGGIPGGQVGGQTGGVVGGEIGGVVGGELGGVQGGEIGGVLGGEVGGTGSGDGEGTGPLRVGGDVKAPIVRDRVMPDYTETARKARVTGVVIVEVVIDSQGNVDRVRVIKGLPMGLTEEAEKAVRRWKFSPGTLNGRPVDVIFNLTVNFQLGS